MRIPLALDVHRQGRAENWAVGNPPIAFSCACEFESSVVVVSQFAEHCVSGSNLFPLFPNIQSAALIALSWQREACRRRRCILDLHTPCTFSMRHERFSWSEAIACFSDLATPLLLAHGWQLQAPHSGLSPPSYAPYVEHIVK